MDVNMVLHGVYREWLETKENLEILVLKENQYVFCVFHVECKACMCVCVCFGCMHMFACECYALSVMKERNYATDME